MEKVDAVERSLVSDQGEDDEEGLEFLVLRATGFIDQRDNGEEDSLSDSGLDGYAMLLWKQ